MSLKHKNQSKWVKRMLQRGQTDGDTREAIAEQLAMGIELRKKVRELDGIASLSTILKQSYKRYSNRVIRTSCLFSVFCTRFCVARRLSFCKTRACFFVSGPWGLRLIFFFFFFPTGVV